MSDKSIKLPSTSDNSLALSLNCIGTKTRLKFEGECLKQNKTTFTYAKTVNIYIVYEINLWDCGYNGYPTLENSLFGAVKLVKIASIDKFKYSGYGIEFNRRGTFPVGNGFGKNVIVFGADMCSSVYTDNKKKNLILGNCPTQESDDTALTAEEICLIDFTESKKKLCLSLHYNEANSYLLVNGVEIHKLKEKDS